MKATLLFTLLVAAPQVASVPAPAPVESPPAPAPHRDPVARSARLTTLPNGLEVYVVEAPNAPIVHVELVTRGGAATDPAHLSGLTFITYGMVYRGGGKWSGQKLSRYRRQLSAVLDTEVRADHGVIALTGPSRHAGRILTLLSEIVLHPDESEVDMARIKKLMRQARFRRSHDPLSAARRRMPSIAFGRDHAYGRDVWGSSRTVALTKDKDVFRHRRRLLVPQRSALIIAGDVRAPQIQGHVEQVFGSWKGKPGTFEPPTEPEATQPRLHLMDRPGSTQTLVCTLSTVLGRGHPDVASFEVVEQLLAGGFTSRLQGTMRERGGYTYGVHSATDWLAVSSRMSVCAKVEVDATRQAVDDLLGALGRMSTSPPTPEEVRGAKRALVGRATAARATLSGLVADAKGHFLRAGRGHDIGAVTAEDVARVAAAVLSSDAAHLLLVGDARKVRPQLVGITRRMSFERSR